MGGRAGSVPRISANDGRRRGRRYQRRTQAQGAHSRRYDGLHRVGQALVDGGRAAFSGAGNCFACHGAMPGGPPLRPT